MLITLSKPTSPTSSQGVPTGVILVKDNAPGDEEDLVPVVNPGDLSGGDSQNEPSPPESFEWP